MTRAEKERETARLWQYNLRQKVLFHLGGCCVRCGFKDSRALQIDHVHGDGLLHRSTTNWRWRYQEVLDSASGDTFQLLCANCNWIKRAEQNENSTIKMRLRKQLRK